MINCLKPDVKLLPKNGKLISDIDILLKKKIILFTRDGDAFITIGHSRESMLLPSIKLYFSRINSCTVTTEEIKHSI